MYYVIKLYKMKKIKKKSGLKIAIFFALLLIFAINYSFFDRFVESYVNNYEGGIVERVIDGDTIVVNGSTVRLLGINTPEKGEVYYEEAKQYMENRTLNKFVKLKGGKEDLDLYKRKLRYVYVSEKNVNEELVRKGYANFYFPSGKDDQYNNLKSAFEECLKDGINLCEKSKIPCAKCVEIKELDVANQVLVLKNSCPYYCDLTGWTIKDEGRKKFTFGDFVLDKEVKIVVDEGADTKDILYWRGKSYVWTKTGDSLFLRDKDNKLVLFYTY